MSSDTLNSSNSGAPTVPVAQSFVGRLKRAFGPVLPGLVLDLADVFSLTRTVGPWVSFPIGFVIGIWLSSYYPFGLGWRFVIALGSGLYTLTPGTGYIPLATILTCLGRFIETPTEGIAFEEHVAAPMAEKTSAESVAVEPDVASRTRTSQSRAACPECGSTTLRYGESEQRFRPLGSGLWAKGHAVNSFACLDCGFVGHYLTNIDVEKLRGGTGAA